MIATASVKRMVTACSLALAQTMLLCAASVQTADAQTVDTLRVRQIEQDVTALQRKVLEQDRRIAQLERELAQRSTGNGRTLPPPPRAGASTPAEQPWHAPINWDRLKAGMSEPEVVGILGTPSLVRELDGHRLMFYGGASSRWGSITGAVELTDGRVTKINPPAFQ